MDVDAHAERDGSSMTTAHRVPAPVVVVAESRGLPFEPGSAVLRQKRYAGVDEGQCF